jgi:hypothetical protein
MRAHRAHDLVIKTETDMTNKASLSNPYGAQLPGGEVIGFFPTLGDAQAALNAATKAPSPFLAKLAAARALVAAEKAR